MGDVQNEERKNEQKSEVSAPTKKKNTSVIWIVLVAVGVVALVVIIVCISSVIKYKKNVKEMQAQIFAFTDTDNEQISLEVLKEEINDIGELSTVEYLYTDAGKFEDPKEMFGKDIPFSFTTKSFVARWDGSIKAGVDLEKIIVEANDDPKEIVIHMPKAEILSHEIDDESIETLDEKNGLFNPIKVEDIRSFDADCKDEMEARAIKNGLLDQAYENAKSIIEKIVNTDVVKEQGYTIRFEIIE